MTAVNNDPMLELFVFETLDLISQLEKIALSSEKANTIESEINEVFRIAHTIKGSAAMMGFDNITSLTHSLEDAFHYLREKRPEGVDYSVLTDVVLKNADFIKSEMGKIQAGDYLETSVSENVQEITDFLSSLKNKDNSTNPDISNDTLPKQEPCKIYGTDYKNHFKAVIFFEDDCGMENIRAFNIIYILKEVADVISYSPQDIAENQASSEPIKQNGFEIRFCTGLCADEVSELLSNTPFIKDLKLDTLSAEKKESCENSDNTGKENSNSSSVKLNLINVSISKLDRLMDLVGELVISQAMVVQNPELEGLSLNSFKKAARQLQKVTDEIQDSVMSIRMVTLSATFQKMYRIVRDMGKKLNKEVILEVAGEDTEVDKNIIEHLSDPLIHLVRNAVDHGIESFGERVAANKPATGKITLEARNEGGDVWITIKDDGRGLNKKGILQKARKQGLLTKPDNELTDKEIYSCVFLPGFSTKEQVTEFSGRGVGMDVVNRNIEEIGGTVQVDSSPGIGTAVSIKIPLTLAIIDGMKVRVGKSIYIIPIISIKESFRAQNSAIIRDVSNNEMMMIRGNCCPVIRLNELFKVRSDAASLDEGIITVVENDSGVLCLFADELLGEQQVVVKALPSYIKKIKGISGCTVMGDGSVSLILDITGIFNSS